MHALQRERGRFATGEHFAAIGNFLGVDGPAQRLHNIELFFAEHRRHIIALLHADAVLASDRAAQRYTKRQDLARQLLGFVQRARLAPVIQNQRVQVAVAGMKDVGDIQLIFLFKRVDFQQRFAQAAARDDAVLHDIIGAQAPDR